MEAPWLSIVVTCMGRLEQVRRTAPRLVRPGVEYVLVDWSCPEGVGAWAREALPGAKVVSVPGRRTFEKPGALAAGVRAATAPWLAVLDADMLVAPGFLEALRAGLRPGVVVVAEDDRRGTGFFACARGALERAGGLDERMRGWGFEDDDLRWRLTRDLAVVRLAPGLLQVLEHDDAARTRFYEEQDRGRSATFNQALVWRWRWRDPWAAIAWPAAPVLVAPGPALDEVWATLELAVHLRRDLGLDAAVHAWVRAAPLDLDDPHLLAWRRPAAEFARWGAALEAWRRAPGRSIAGLAREVAATLDAPEAAAVPLDEADPPLARTLPAARVRDGCPVVPTRRRWRPWWRDAAPRPLLALGAVPAVAEAALAGRDVARLPADAPPGALVDALAGCDLAVVFDEAVLPACRATGAPTLLAAARARAWPDDFSLVGATGPAGLARALEALAEA